MTESEPTRTVSPTDRAQSVPTNNTDVDIVQTLNEGDIITATHLTPLQHERYLENPDNKLKQMVYSDRVEYLVLKTADTDDSDIFAAKIIHLDDYDPNDIDKHVSPYEIPDDDDDGPRMWNITSPRAPYDNEGTGIVISRAETTQTLKGHILQNLEITGYKNI